VILKTLVGFLLGFILGVGGTVFMVTSGAGNYIVAANPRVQELEEKIREVVGEREFATRRLEDVARLTERMATRFEDLERRFSEIQHNRTAALGDDTDGAASDSAPAAATKEAANGAAGGAAGDTPESDSPSAPGT